MAVKSIRRITSGRNGIDRMIEDGVGLPRRNPFRKTESAGIGFECGLPRRYSIPPPTIFNRTSFGLDKIKVGFSPGVGPYFGNFLVFRLWPDRVEE